MKLLRSFRYAVHGLKSCFVTEANFRIHVLLAALALGLAVLFKISTVEWMATGFSIAFVLVMEMLNTAIEKLCNVVDKEFNSVIKTVKDIAAGAVLVSALFSLITGLVIFLPKIITFLSHF